VERDAVRGERALSEKGREARECPKRKKNLLGALGRLRCSPLPRDWSKSASQPGRVTLGSISISA